MVSRRRILSRSRDDLNLEMSPGYPQQEEEEDVWYNRDKLYKVSFGLQLFTILILSYVFILLLANTCLMQKFKKLVGEGRIKTFIRYIELLSTFSHCNKLLESIGILSFLISSF